MAKTLPFGGIQVPVPGFGAMGISFGMGNNLSLEEAEPVLLKAIELGCTFWDTAVSAQGIYLYPKFGTSNTKGKRLFIKQVSMKRF
jgi:predicted aldo/keto reductase-like oxidoreductase